MKRREILWVVFLLLGVIICGCGGGQGATNNANNGNNNGGAAQSTGTVLVHLEYPQGGAQGHIEISGDIKEPAEIISRDVPADLNYYMTYIYNAGTMELLAQSGPDYAPDTGNTKDFPREYKHFGAGLKARCHSKGKPT